MTRFSILSQTGLAALAQANQATSSVLALLR
jgi:flagellin-like hook-associated protein FlgL